MTKYNIFDSCDSIASSIVINIINAYESNKGMQKEQTILSNFLKEYGEHKYNDGYNTALDVADDIF